MNLNEDFHVHSNYNDHSTADLTISNVLQQAEKKGLKTLAFTEHVRKTSGDWISDYLHEIEDASSAKSSKLEVIAGFEGKILPDGSIDCPEEYASKYFLVASFHSPYQDKQAWIRALEKAIQNPDVDVIGHLAPEPSFELNREELKTLASLIVSNNKIVEVNAKYQRPPIGLLKIFRHAGVKFHLASDAHSLQEVGDFSRISHLISFIDGKEADANHEVTA